MHIAPGSIVGGKYRIERPLSEGGMGSVWMARHVTLGSLVAVKFMAPALATVPSFVARFEREARIAASLQSPHVVHVQDHGIDGGHPYIVMELLRGEDLDNRLRRVRRLSLPDATRILMQAGKALRRAHEARLVHRDLKPGNIFLARVEDEEIVKILDFGIAKDVGSRPMTEVTRTGEVLGSPYYMSPEQVRGDRDVDHRSDLWSLAVILFRAITGELPFPGDELGAVLAKILVDPLPRPTQVAPDLPRAIDTFFARALEREPARRFQSVNEMLDDLARITGVRRPAASIPEMAQPVVGERASSISVIGLAPTAPAPPEATPVLSPERSEGVMSRAVRRSDDATVSLHAKPKAAPSEPPLLPGHRASSVPALRATDPSAVTDSGASSSPEEPFQLPVTSTRPWFLGVAAAAVLGGGWLVWVASKGDVQASTPHTSLESLPAQQRETMETRAPEARLPRSAVTSAQPSAPPAATSAQPSAPPAATSAQPSAPPAATIAQPSAPPEPTLQPQGGPRAPQPRAVALDGASAEYKATAPGPAPRVPSTPEAADEPVYPGPAVPPVQEQVRAAPQRPFHDLFARRVLVEAAAQAKRCATATGPTGTGVVQVTFAPNGRVGHAVVVGQPFAATDVASCVASIFRGAEIPPFSGGPITRSQSFSIP
ncbi:protein kinase domain-containing protein [Sorangium sp. So ce1024]|uniref:serine/threonine-protein kinase n=1 Tax=Sorangium sp. So ce1024 TaxID=3133327 RepID=UPI003EFCC3DE